MRIFNDTFQEAIAFADSVDLRFTIEMEWDAEGTELVYFLSHEDSGAPEGATTIHSIHSISSTSQSLNNRYAIAEIGSLSFKLADIEDAITTELGGRFESNVTPVQKKCTVYMGTKDLDWVDYEPVDSWIIEDIENTGPGYAFRGSDVQRLLRQKVFTPDKARLSQSMTVSQTHIPITVPISSTKFPAIVHDAGYTYNPSATVGYVKIDDEIIAHNSTITNHSSDGPSLGVVQRGALNTQATAHTTDQSANSDRGKEVTEIIYIEGRVVDIAHLVMTGRNVANSATIPDHWHAGIDTDFIHAASFSEINAELSNRRLRFIGEKEQDLKRFVEQQCMRFYGLFQTVTSQGKFKLHRYERTLQETSPVAYVNANTLIDIDDLGQKAQDVINVYSIKYNWDYLSERSTRELTYLDVSSSNANGGLIKSESFEFRGVHTALHSDNDIRNFIYQTRELYSNAPYKTRIKVNRELLGLEVGDVINVDTSERKDYVSGTTTLNRPFMITRRSVDLSSGETSLELIGTGLRAEAVLDPDAVGSPGELEDSFLTGTGTNLESLAQVTGGVVTTNLTLTGTSNINASGSIWYLDGDLVIPNGVTLTLVNNVQLRATGEIVVQNGGKINGKGKGRAGAVYPNTAGGGYFGTTKAGVGEVQAPTSYWYGDFNTGIIKRLPDPAPVAGSVQSLPFFKLRNEDGELTGLPSDLRGTSGGSGGQAVGDAAGDGGDGGNGGAGFITISRGFTIETGGIVDLSGNNGTAGAEPMKSYDGGSIKFYAGGGGGGCPGGWLCIIDGDFTGPTSNQVTANRGHSPFSSPRAHNRTGFNDKNMSAAAFRVQFVPARKVVEDDNSTGARQLKQVTGLSATSSAATLLIHANGSLQERALVSWSALLDTAVDGYQMQAKRTTDSDWITQAFTTDDNTSAYFDVEDGVQYHIRVRAFGSGVIPGPWSATLTHTAVGQSNLAAIAAPTGASVVSGEEHGLINSDGTKTERMKVTWAASADVLWTGTGISYQETFSLPSSFSPGVQGGSGDLVYTLNTRSDGTADIGELRIQATRFVHLDGNTRTIQASADVRTNFGEGAAGDFYLMWSDTVRATRFPTGTWGSSTNLIPIRWNGSAWVAFDNSGAASAVTIVATDCIIAKVNASATSGGLTSIVPLTQWNTIPNINEKNVTSAYLIGTGSKIYNIRLRHLSRTRPNSSYTAVDNHTLQPFATIAAPTSVAVASGTNQLLQIGDGTILERMKVTWAASTDPYWTGTRISYRPVAGTWRVAGNVRDINVTELYIVEKSGIQYEVQVMHLSVIRPMQQGVVVTHTLIGKTAPPSDVTGFVASLTAGQDQITLAWNQVTDLDLSHYEIRVGGTDWATAALVTKAAKQATSQLLPLQPAGTYTYRIKAVDTTGNYSTNAASDGVTVVAPQAPQNLNAVDGFGQGTLYWDAISTNEYDVFEIRVGGTDWASATFVARIRSNRFAVTGYASGIYTFRVRTINKVGTESSTSSVEIEIFPQEFSNLNWAFKQKILPPAGYSGLQMLSGRCLNTEGNLMIAMALNTTTNIRNIMNYRRSGSGFEHLQSFTGSTTGTGESLIETAMSGNGLYIVSGNSTDDVAFTNSGSVYVFVRAVAGMTLSQQTIINSPNAQSGGSFGGAVVIDLDGDTIAIGAKDETVGAQSSAGRVYIYTRSGSTWTLQATLTEPTPAANADFGASVVLSDDGNRLLVRCGGNSETFYFERTGGTWSAGIAMPSAGDEQFYTNFEMSADGNIAAVHGRDVSNNEAIYFFQYDAGTWDFIYKLPEESGAGSQWGVGLYLSSTGRFVVVSDRTIQKLYVYGTSDFTRWFLIQTLQVPSSYTASNVFGIVVYMSRDARYIVTADSEDDEAGTNFGAIYYFELSPLSLS